MFKPTLKVEKKFSDLAIVENAMRAMASYCVKNGILSGVGAHPDSKSGATVASIAAWNEFGVPQRRIPARPFMRNTYVELMGAHKSFIVDSIKTLVFKKDGVRLRKNPMVRKLFEVLGLKIQSLMQGQIDKGGDPAFAPNAQSTIDAKGSSQPLFSSGILKKSLSYAVVNN